jgi:hypothetical protein
MNKWVKYSLIFVAGLLIILAFWFFGKPNNDTNNFISILGTYLELYGLTITILEILEVRKVTTQIELSVQETKKKFQSIFSLSDISRSSKTIAEIQSYLGNNQMQMAYLRLKDLQKVLIESDIRTLFNLLNDAETVQICCAKVFSDIDDLHSCIYHNGVVDRNAVSQNLEKLSRMFTTLEEKIKNNNV